MHAHLEKVSGRIWRRVLTRWLLLTTFTFALTCCSLKNSHLKQVKLFLVVHSTIPHVQQMTFCHCRRIPAFSHVCLLCRDQLVLIPPVNQDAQKSTKATTAVAKKDQAPARVACQIFQYRPHHLPFQNTSLVFHAAMQYRSVGNGRGHRLVAKPEVLQYDATRGKRRAGCGEDLNLSNISLISQRMPIKHLRWRKCVARFWLPN